ncbi:hypothetical protein G3T36_02490 [Diaminobutyricibacter tongyongensis]|uniref:Uncharacterized protein n=1 Tax=Leifsonia tongyongensis TaxID=1268043 RepID=A0A6L9XTK4_9MICO|nr:hypothetical protein [Diaminobutyricibacter tongyongensis]NEN04729.1 hypothetical protein [Diaminobutyricibacter tongyongensis]
MADDGKTYSDLMDLLPEVAEIRIRWKLDEDGLPWYAESFTLIGHGGATLAEADTEELEATASRRGGPTTADLPLAERLRAVSMVLGWVDPFSLDERDGVSILALPSPDHISDTVPATWGDPTMELELSKSPRDTWVWATDREQAEKLQALLTASGCQAYPARGENAEDRTLDLDIGVVAMEGLMCLQNAGYSFRWHPTMRPLDKTEDLYGVPVAGAE